MNGHPWWYIARTAGLVSWGLLTISTLVGFGMVTRRVRSMSNSLATHRITAGLGLGFALLHIAALMLDHFVETSWLEVFVPYASVWRPGPVAWGVAGMYLLVLVEVSSLIRRRLPNDTWRRIHVNSYLLFLIITIHFLTAGTDVNRWIPRPVEIAFGAAVVVFAGWASARAMERMDPGG